MKCPCNIKIDGWKYYNHAAIPNGAPNEIIDITPIQNGDIWKMDGKPYLARWTTDWDCGYETQWWYVIKDTPFDINELKSKRRYEINKGNKNFTVRIINPGDFTDRIIEIANRAYATYPEAYRPQIDHEHFASAINNSWAVNYVTYGAFSKEDGSLCGYTNLICTDRYVNLCELKAIPNQEKLGVNAAMLCSILNDNEQFLAMGGYICDGARSIQHETHFQEYLEKYFEFRKAYCKLHLAYKCPLNVLISILYPLRKMLYRITNLKIVRKVNIVLRMEEIVRME